jgi:hypothetical protein
LKPSNTEIFLFHEEGKSEIAVSFFELQLEAELRAIETVIGLGRIVFITVEATYAYSETKI